MLIIVVTGGVGSGKSTVVDMFKQHSVPVIDTDVIARQIVDSNKDILEQIATQFGRNLITSDGHLDRKKLRQIVFSDTKAREQLQALLHPLIRQQAIKQLNEIDAPYCLLVIPLFFETGQAYPHDRVLVVDVQEEIQLQRAAQRDKEKIQTIKNIMAAQASREQRLSIADDIIDNNNDLNALQQQVDRLHHKYLDLVNKARQA